MSWDKVVKALTGILGALAGLLGEWSIMLTLLAVAMGVDYLSGLIVAWRGRSPKTEGGGVLRDELLAECDYVMMSDYPMDGDQREAWAGYRQALRDIPGQAGFPRDVIYPAAPGEGEADAD